MSEENISKIITQISETLQSEPPTIGVIGASGVGKSSTLNSLFKTDIETSATVRCTREFSDHLIAAQVRRGAAEGQEALLRVVDAPGLGEDVAKDDEYLEMYTEHLPRCDVILWVMTARNRAVALDQRYLQQLEPFHSKMVFGINQVDLVEPINWNSDRNLPSPEQASHLDEIADDRRKRIESLIGREISLICYGAKQYYRLTNLFEMMLEACPPDRRWLFDLVRSVTPKDWLDQARGISDTEKARILSKYS